MEPGFRHCRQILFHLSHQGSPHISCHCSICFVLLSMKKKVAQPCPTLCDLMDYAVHGVLQARILEWVAPAPDLEIQISRGSSQPRDGTQVACIAGDSLLTGRQGKPKNTRWVDYLSPGDLSDPGIQLRSPALQADSLPTELSGKLIRLSQLILWHLCNMKDVDVAENGNYSHHQHSRWFSMILMNILISHSWGLTLNSNVCNTAKYSKKRKYFKIFFKENKNTAKFPFVFRYGVFTTPNNVPPSSTYTSMCNSTCGPNTIVRKYFW